MRFYGKKNGLEFLVINTHFPLANEESKLSAAKELCEQALYKGVFIPTIAVGDFNLFYNNAGDPTASTELILKKLSSQFRSRAGDCVQLSESYDTYIKGTYMGYPYDKFRRTDIVPHALINAFSNVPIESRTTDATMEDLQKMAYNNSISPVPVLNGQTVKTAKENELVNGKIYSENVYPSDHLALFIQIPLE